MRQVSALTVRLVLPSSLTRKNKLLPRALKIISMMRTMNILVNICYTPMDRFDGNKKVYILTGFRWRFTPSWQMSVLAALAIALLLRLGFWQLDRAQEKQQLMTLDQNFSKQSPVRWDPGLELPRHYERVVLQGRFLPQQLLLDNQHHQHQFGYHVLSPLLLANQKVVLIDRGWVRGEVTRKIFPDIDRPMDLVSLAGHAYYPSEKVMVLGQSIEIKDEQLAVVEWIDLKIISQFLHKSVYPFMIRLDKNEAYGFVREWPVVSMSPQRHYGYAMQWFSLASVCLILFLALNVKRCS